MRIIYLKLKQLSKIGNMEIPEKYRKIYLQAVEKDSELEKGKGVLKSRKINERQVKNMIRCDYEIARAKQKLRDHGIDTSSID